MYFYWLRHCPEDISRVGNVLNITGPTIRGQERQLVQTPDCRAAAISQNVKDLVSKPALFCSAMAPGWTRQAGELTGLLSSPLTHSSN